MVFTNTALAGALLGLAFGVAEYVIIMRLIEANLWRSRRMDGELAGREKIMRRLRAIRLSLMASGIIVMPVLGFIVGSTLGPATGAAR